MPGLGTTVHGATFGAVHAEVAAVAPDIGKGGGASHGQLLHRLPIQVHCSVGLYIIQANSDKRTSMLAPLVSQQL